MSATVYRDPNFGGAYARIAARGSRPTVLSGRRLVGQEHPRALAPDVELDNEISSIRVDTGTIAVLFGGHAASASGGARAIVGPRDVADLGALGMDDKVSAIHVMSFDPYEYRVGTDPPVVLHSGYARGGKFAHLDRGDYDEDRLASEEVRFATDSLRSLTVPAGTVVVLYDGPDFDEDKDAVAVAGPARVDDLDRLGLIDRVSSVRVFRTAAAPRAPARPIVVRPAESAAEADNRLATTATPAPAAAVVTAAKPPAAPPSLPLWAIVIIVLLVLVILVGIGLNLKSPHGKYPAPVRPTDQHTN